MPSFTSCIKRYDSSAFRVLCRLIFCLCLSTFAGAQRQSPPSIDDEPQKPFPSTPKQIEDLLKSDHQHNLRDLEKMSRLLEQVQKDEDKNEHHAVSMQSLKNLEQIEKLSKAIRERMKRY